LESEYDVVLLTIVSFIAAEFVVIQLFGVSLEFMCFVTVLGLYLTLRRLVAVDRNWNQYNGSVLTYRRLISRHAD
jgi:hypothetical protein